jgi:competence protein ComGC
MNQNLTLICNLILILILFLILILTDIEMVKVKVNVNGCQTYLIVMKTRCPSYDPSSC